MMCFMHFIEVFRLKIPGGGGGWKGATWAKDMILRVVSWCGVFGREEVVGKLSYNYRARGVRNGDV